jgi:hypothetical protein
MRKGSRTITVRAGEKTKSLPDMMKEMSDMIMKIKMPDMIMKIKMPDMTMKMKMPEQMEHRRAGCGTLMFKRCFSSRRVKPELPLERKPS